MFEVITLDIERAEYWEDTSRSCIYALSFNAPEERRNGITHKRMDGDGSETCAEYNRRVVGKVARNQKWCSSCTELITRKMVVRDCIECHEDQKVQSRARYSMSYTLDHPDWWSFDDEDEMEQLTNCPMSFGHDKSCPWLVTINHFHTGFKPLGFSPDCQVCCGLAKPLLLRIREYGHKRIRIQNVNIEWSEFKSGAMEFRNSLPIKATVQWDDHEQGSNWRWFDVKLCPLNNVNGPGLGYHELRRSNVAVIKQHIQRQFKKYPVENLQQTAGYPPSFRLIDVNKRCVVNIGNKHVRYSAISYRWDSKDKSMLTEETKGKFSQHGSLSPETMSKTLYDCMNMAKALDIPYIWIDRYCIMQGDENEKAEQIHAMGDIYTNSYLTFICALRHNIHSGIPGYTRDFDGKLKLPSTDGCWGVADNIPYLRDGEPEWKRRGWTMQEEYLSTRRLYLTDSTILWHINCPMVAYHHADIAQEPECRPECETAKSRSQFDLVKEYSTRELSVSIDRVNAITGLFNTRGIEHVFGIPTDKIQYSLGWWTPPSFKPHINQFPTWSWAHLFCGVLWDPRHVITGRVRCKALHANTIPQKRISLIRQISLPMAIFHQLSDRQLLMRARVWRIEPSAHLLGDSDGNPCHVSPSWLGVPIQMKYHSQTYCIAIEPFTPSGIVIGDGIIHARRIGHYWTPRKNTHLLDHLARIRPLAIQTLTILKRRRLGRCTVPKKWAAKWAQQNTSHHSPMKLRLPSSIRPKRSGYPDTRLVTSPKVIQDLGGLKRKRLRKLWTKMKSGFMDKWRKALDLQPPTLAKKQKRHRQVKRPTRRRPVHRPFFGYDSLKENSSFRTVILH